ncbi:MAG: GNAT family N-acetyltransferase [Alphaproteobacteria bacterium]
MPLYKNPDFLRLPPGLARIFGDDRQQSFFALPQWYDLMTRFGVEAGTEIRVYTDERPDASAALLLRREREQQPLSLLSFTNFYSIEHGPVSAVTTALHRALGAIIAEIMAERPRWDCVRLFELDPSDGSYGDLLCALRRAGLLVECTPGAGTWFEATGGMGFRDYLAKRPSQLLSTWQRKRRSLAATGRLTAAFFSEPAGINTAITDYETVYAASWKTPEPFPHFIPELIRLAAARGALRMGLYYIDGLPAAAQFWILWRGRAVIYKLAHDRRFDKLSLGTLLTMDMVERVLEQDHPEEINFGRGDDPYKRLWLPRRRQQWGITAANPRTLRGLRLGLEREAAKLYHRMRGEPVTPRAASLP